MFKIKWVFRMAMRDFKKNIGRLFLFISSIVIGIAALVAITSFGDNLKGDIDQQAKELLGADLELKDNQDLLDQPIDSLAISVSNEINFASMVLFPQSGESKLTQVRALEGEYPFYGQLETVPVNAEKDFRNGGRKALVEKVLMAQFNAQVGDSIKVGNVTFVIEGELQKVPGQTGITAMVAPAVYIPLQYLEETGLVQYGSRLNYVRYYLFDSSQDVEALKEKYSDVWEENKIRVDSIEDRKVSTGNSFQNLADFLALVAFIALLLGSVGVASAVNVFVKEKMASVAVLRCMGVSSSMAMWIYLTQIILMGLFGAIVGGLLGTGLQMLLPMVLQDFVPVEMTIKISWMSLGIGIFTGLLIAFLFALMPMLKIRKVSPMATLRPEDNANHFKKDPLRLLVILLIIGFIFSYSFYLLNAWKLALGFTVFVLVSFLLLFGLASLVMWGIRKFLPISLTYPIRQSLANLYRPNNQTVSLVATIGLGTAMISTLFFMQSLLLEEVRFADKNDQPNMLLFDIQTPQLEEVKQKIEEADLPIIQSVPIVTMSLNEINGVDKKTNDSLPEKERRSKGLYNREFRVTYRDSLIASEKLIEGKLRSVKDLGDSIFISVDKNYASRTGIKMGDEIIFDVQGRKLTTFVGSFRDVKYNQVSTNFLVLFPDKVLEQAPKFHVLVTKTKNDRQAADVQSIVVRAFPNISVINLGTIVETFDLILQRITFVIQFMAFFSIATGVLVLISSLMISKYQRMRESVLLKTLGAQSPLISKINTLEYFFLGSLASLSGIVLSFIAVALLSQFVFNLNFVPAFQEALMLYVVITFLTVIIGWLNGRNVIDRTPMEILRS
jgi:putative ABC transport system permease protein